MVISPEGHPRQPLYTSANKQVAAYDGYCQGKCRRPFAPNSAQIHTPHSDPSYNQTLETLSTKSDMAGAIRYGLSRWAALTRYLDDGTVEIDNNAAERALRVVALGRKNYLFAGSQRGGERAAAIYSLLGTAKLNGINPEHYLRYVLTHIADHPIHRIAEFLPWNIQTALTSVITTDA